MSLSRVLYVAFVAVFFLPTYSHAYIDPGTGSLILQALIAGGIAALAFVRGIREKRVSGCGLSIFHGISNDIRKLAVSFKIK